ncbi:MAG: DUF5655 domain-containing protein [Pyrinomonadaceae bacterium]
MAQKTSGEFEKEFMDGLAGSTGKDLAAWLQVVDSFASKKRNEMIARLKDEHKFNHMQASLLAGIHANGGKPVYASTDDLLENQFAKAADMRAIYDAFVGFVANNFPAATILPKKTYVSVLENREFGAVNIKKNELRIGLDLGDKPFDEKVEKAKLTGPMPRISHMVVVTDATQLDGNLVDLLRQSRARCH